MLKKNACYFLLFLTLACSENENPKSRTQGYYWENHVPFKSVYNTFNMPFTDDFELIPESKGEVSMSEASGIAYSFKNDGKIWAHNDSGHPNVLFLLDAETGETVTKYTIGGTLNIDWEDMEISKGPDDNEIYLYVGDIGDNTERRPSYSIYRFPEPVFEESHRGQNLVLNDLEVERIIFNYPDGSHDAESLMVDPHTLDIYVVTKRDVVSMLYVAPYPQKVSEQFSLYKAGEFGFRTASAATISLDGTKVLIKNRQEIFYWERENNEETVDMLSRAPVKAPYIGEPQGEAICFDEAYNYYTLSEAFSSDIKPILFKYLYKN